MNVELWKRCARFGTVEWEGSTVKIYYAKNKYETLSMDRPVDFAVWMNPRQRSDKKELLVSTINELIVYSYDSWGEYLTGSCIEWHEDIRDKKIIYSKTDYCVKGPKESLDTFHEFMKEVQETSSFSLLALSDLTGELFGKHVSASGGFWTHLSRTSRGVEFSLWTDAGPMYLQAAALKSRWPDLRFFFRNQGNMEHRHKDDGISCIKNDRDGECFPERWMTEFCKGIKTDGNQLYRTDRQYFTNPTDALRHIGALMGVDAPKDAEAVKALNDRFNDKNEFCKLHYFHLVNDFGDIIPE